MIDACVAWVKKPRSLVWLGVAALLAVVGHLLEGVDVLAWLGDVTAAFYTSLDSIDALRIIDLFYLRLTGCHVDQIAAGAAVVCDGLNAAERFGTYHPVFLAVIAPLDAAWSTLRALMVETTALGMILFLATIVTSAILLNRWIGPFENGFFAFGLWVVLIPVGAGLLALALKWILLVFTLIFSTVLGLLITFAFAIKIVLAVLGVLERAEKLEAGAAALLSTAKGAGGPPQK
jgi:hypothetical protein